MLEYYKCKICKRKQRGEYLSLRKLGICEDCVRNIPLPDHIPISQYYQYVERYINK